jgi:ABC-2 type transport system permease protein
MSGLLATLERELRAYFYSPLAYVILTFFLIINGGIFSLIVGFLSDPRAAGSTTPLKLFFGDTFFFWLVLLIVTPVLTMRLLAEERKSGTIESLMTAPVTEFQVVLGKYLAALAFYVFLWVPTLAYVAIVAQSSTVDPGPIVGGYLGVLGLGAVFLACGIFASSFSRNQIVSALTSFAMLITLFTVGFFDSLVTGETAKAAVGYMNLLEHMDEFGRGVVDTRRLVYYVTTIALFLFLSARVLEAKKWR